MSFRLLVFGGHGQVGRALIEVASDTACEAIGLSHAEADICDAVTVTDVIRRYAPACVVNAAAYTAVDKAEIDPNMAFRVNCDGARVVAAASAKADLPLVHLSTDYVFDGRGKVPFTETDHVAPLGVYGRSKEAGERAVRDAAPKHVILRSSWIYSPYGTNFVRTMLRLGVDRAELRIVNDQTGCPTSAADIATAIVAIAKRVESKNFADWGTYHFSGADSITWYDFAELIFEESAKFGVKAPKLTAISSAEYRAPAPRPAYSVLDTKKLEQTFGFKPRPLRESLVQCLRRIF